MHYFVKLIALFSTVILFTSFSLKNDTGKVYFIRSTGYTGSATSFKVFIDGEFVCKLNNNKYSIHEVSIGKHTCSVQFAGKKSKDKAEKFEINVLPNGENYMNVVLEVNAFINNTYCEELTKESAKRRMNKLIEDKKCL